VCAFISAYETRSLVFALVNPAIEERVCFCSGEDGESKSHCQVVMFRGTETFQYLFVQLRGGRLTVDVWLCASEGHRDNEWKIDKWEI